jgi:uncharacterized protein
MQYPELLIFFFTIALIYATVGFGGGSSYLAVLALYSFPFTEMRLIALLCNIIVVSGGMLIFIRQKQVEWKRLLPIVACSIPFSFLGARLKIGEDAFFILLGCTLIIASFFLWINTHFKSRSIERKKIGHYPIRNGAIGGTIGFLSGMVGIGGGIFLSPLLNLMDWDTAKKVAAAASVFIFFNSVAGIIGQLNSLPHDIDFMRILLLCLAVFLGGQIGSRFGAGRLPHLAVKRITAVLVFVAGIEVLVKHLHL